MHSKRNKKMLKRQRNPGATTAVLKLWVNRLYQRMQPIVKCNAKECLWVFLCMRIRQPNSNTIGRRKREKENLFFSLDFFGGCYCYCEIKRRPLKIYGRHKENLCGIICACDGRQFVWLFSSSSSFSFSFDSFRFFLFFSRISLVIRVYRCVLYLQSAVI